MKLLEERIRREGKVLEQGAVLKVDSFLNHQMDVALFQEMGREFFRLFGNERATKILTVEASGIGIACITGQYFRVPVLFAKKSQSRTLGQEVYAAPVESFTHGTRCRIFVSREFLMPEDRVLLLDDFLANGSALRGLMELARQAGAAVVGAGVCIEKAFQPGGDQLRSAGLRVESLARIQSMSESSGVVFC